MFIIYRKVFDRIGKWQPNEMPYQLQIVSI